LFLEVDMTVPAVRGISSMATRAVLAELASMYEREQGGPRPDIESVGGVDAAKRVAAGEAVDVVVLAADAIAKLEGDGHLVRGSAVDVVRSEMAVAIPVASVHPSVESESALKTAVMAAHKIAYSTGPSGQALLRLFEHWGVAAAVADRLVQARAGVPVGTLLARGDADIGFQQLSELVGVEGIAVLGPLPEPIRVTTIFSAAVARTATSPDQARDFLAFLTSPITADIKLRHGMEHVPAAA
jgi:molybdate transport system substrate-binding protein